MNHPHLIACLTHCGTWLLGIGVGYIAARRDWRAEAGPYVAQWRAAHARLRARIAELEAPRARDPHLADTLSGGATYEQLFQRIGQ